jgi:hypothetical protein
VTSHDGNKKSRKERPEPLANAHAYRFDEAQRMGGPGPTKCYELAAAGRLRLVRVGRLTRVEGDSLRELLGVQQHTE